MNYKQKLLPIIISVILSGGLFGCGNDKTAEEYLNNAQISLEQGKNAEAIISLKNILKIDGANLEARFLLGKSYAKQGKWLAAEKELIRARESSYEPMLVLPMLADVYSRLGDSQSIVVLLEEGIINNGLESNLRYFLGKSYLFEGETSLALVEFNKVVEFGADSDFGILSQAWIYGLSKQSDLAIQVIDKLSDGNSHFAEVLELKARTLFTANKMDLAINSFKNYLQISPQDHQNRLMYAMALARENNFEEAEAQADYLIKISPHNTIVNQIKSQARFASKDFEEAKKFAEIAIRGNQYSIISHIVAGVSAYRLDQLELAHTYLVAIKDQLSYTHPARRLLTAIRFQLGYADENFKDLSQASLETLDSQLLLVSAQELFKVGKVSEAEHLMQRASQLEPENAKIIYQQGMIKTLNDDDSSIDFFKEALEKDPELDMASISLIMTLTIERKYEEALVAAEQLKQRKPIIAHGLIGGIYLNQDNIEQAKKAFSQVITLDENNIGGLFYLARIAQKENKIEDSIKYYKKILQVNKYHLPSITSLIELPVKEEIRTSIEKYFQTKLVEEPNNSMMILALAEYYIAQREYEKAKKVAFDGLNVQPNDRALLMLNAKVDTYLKNYGDALKHLDATIDDKKQSRQDAVIYASKASIFFLKGDVPSAIIEQEKAAKYSTNENIYSLNLISLYLKNNDVKAARTLAYKVEPGFDEDIRLIELKGRIEFLDHHYEKALPLLRTVHIKAPSEQVSLEIITALQKLGKQQDALTFANNISAEQASFKLQLKKAELYTEKQPKQPNIK
jgi:putative PEP-CTERM system TPR-repeat lipoprotein